MVTYHGYLDDPSNIKELDESSYIQVTSVKPLIDKVKIYYNKFDKKFYIFEIAKMFIFTATVKKSSTVARYILKNADDKADGDHFTFYYNKLTFSKRKRGRLFYELDQEVTQKMINKLVLLLI